MLTLRFTCAKSPYRLISWIQAYIDIQIHFDQSKLELEDRRTNGNSMPVPTATLPEEYS